MSALQNLKPKAQPPLELRDSELARRFVLEGLLLQSVQPPLPEAIPAVLEWYWEAAAEGFPLPPIGVVADVGHLAFGQELQAENSAAPEDQIHRPQPSSICLPRCCGSMRICSWASCTGTVRLIAAWMG